MLGCIIVFKFFTKIGEKYFYIQYCIIKYFTKFVAMSAIPNYTGKKVSIKSTGAIGVIKESHMSKSKQGVLTIIFQIELETGIELRLRPHEVDVLD
jgi:hypothetical protein